MTEAIRGIKQAIVAQAMLNHGVKSLTKEVKAETKEEIIKEAQKKLDARKIGGDARQITNYLLNPAHHQTEAGEPRSLTAIAERLKGVAKTARKAPAKKTAKKAASKSRKNHAKESSEVAAAA